MLLETILLGAVVFIGLATIFAARLKPPAPTAKPKYDGIRDLAAWHRNVATRWSD